MVENILHIQWHQGSKHTQYRGIKTHFVTDAVTVPVLLFSTAPCFPPRATCPALSHLVLCSLTTPPAHRRSGAPCTCFTKPTTGTGRTREGRFPVTASLFLPDEGSEHSRDVAESLAYWSPPNKKDTLLQGAKEGQDCLTPCAAACN